MKPFLYILFVLFSNALFAGNNDTSKEIFEKLHHEGLFLEAMQEGRGMIYLNETPNDLEYAVFLDKLAECEYELEEYASAMNHLRKSLNIKKKVCGKKSVEYATTLHHIANCYSYMNDGKAENKEQNAFNIIQKTTEKWSEKYIEFLLYTLDYSNSDEVYGIADVLLKKTDVNSASMGHVFELIANYFFDNSNYLMAIEYYKKSIEHRSKDYGIYHPVYAERLSSLANCYWRLGMLSKSLELYNQAYLIAKKAYGEYHITSLNVLSIIARTEAEMGNFHDAESIINKVLFLSSQKYGKNSIEYATFLALYGSIKLEQLDTDKAYSYIKESNKLIGKKEGKNSYNYVMNILNMSVSQYDNGNYKEAMKLINRYIRKANKVFGKDHELYQRGLLEKYRLTDDLDKSVKMLKNDLRTLEKDSSVNILGHTYEILAEKFFKIDFDSCVYYQNKALEVYESLYGKSHSRYISSKGVLGDYYFRFKKYKQSSDIFQEYLALKKEEIINRVVFMDYNERNNFFGRFNYVLNEEIPLIAYYNKTDNGLSKALYDAVLMKKGFLLNVEITLKDLLVEQRDSSIIQLYENLELLSKLKELTIESQASINVETDSLFERMQELETLLINKSSIYSLAKKRLLIESDDIQNIINSSFAS